MLFPLDSGGVFCGRVGMGMGEFRKWFLLCLVLLMTGAGWAQGSPGQGRRSFRIGYVRQDPEAVTTSAVFQRMKDFLMAQPEIVQSMERAGISEIVPQSFDSHVLLVEAMDAEQLDLAFCSVIDYGYQRGSYEPIFQIRRAGDPHSSTGGRRAWHSGVIFVNNRSELFDMGTTAAVAALPDYVNSHEIAMVGSSSAAGYVYPFLALDRLTSAAPVMTGHSVFWGSSAEVVKAVINGIHTVGACDSEAVDEVLKAYGLFENKGKLVKELLRTDPVPRDPVVIQTRWLAQSNYEVTPETELGRRVIRGISGFFESNPRLPRLDRTTREAYQEVSENVEKFRGLRK
jgi:ABC-type phosphate/phosphonate transport system substrate-binding protein